MNAPESRVAPRDIRPHPIRRWVHVAVVAGLIAGLPSLDAAAQSAEEILEEAQRKLHNKQLLEPFTPDVRAAIREEYRRLGRGDGMMEQAIYNVTATPGSSNSAVKQDAFAQTVYPIVRDNCRSCHAGAGPGFPSLAHSNATTAYSAVVTTQKVRLSDPPRSRLVQRLVADNHYCWSDCDDDGAEMEAAIAAWAEIEESLGGGGIDVNVISSLSSSMTEGTVDKAKGRFEDRVIAKWMFKEGQGEVARDSSKVEPAIDLEVRDAEWISGWGLNFQNGGWARGTPEASRKLYKYIAHPEKGSQQYTVEAWVAPANIDQDNFPRIVSYSDGTSRRNFTLAQNLYTYAFRNRTTAKKIDRNGMPALVTSDEDEDAQAALQHVVVTYDRVNGRKVFVNGRFTGDKDPVRPKLLLNWNHDFRVVMGNETSGNREWMGQIRFVAIHDVALTKKQIKQNFKEGVGQRFLVRFGLDEWLATTGNVVEFTVQEFDNYSYLFCAPRFSGPPPLDYIAEGMQISVNGEIPVSGQAFVNTQALVLQDEQEASRLCSVIPKDLGVDEDRFNIHFRRLGDFQNIVSSEPPEIVPPEDDPDVKPDIGIRPFEQVHLSMAALTGISANEPLVGDTYREIREALPTGPEARSFLSSHQVGVAKLAVEYCNALVEDPVQRDVFFGTNPAFEFTAPVPTAFSTPAKQAIVTDALFDNMIGVALADQPTRAQVTGVVDALIADLTAGCDAASCPEERTRAVVTAACTSVLSSATTLIY